MAVLLIELPAMLIFGVTLLVGLATGELPHRTCSYNTGKFMQCERVNIEIPDTFDVNLLPPDLKELSLECPQSNKSNQSNVIHSVEQAFPHRPSLSTIWLKGFKNSDDSQFSVSGLLINNRQITYLSVRHSRIYYIDRNFLAGFQFLATLYLAYNDIDDIRIDAFESFLLPSGGSVLKKLFLRGNRLQNLNWNVLQPVANSLGLLDLSAQEPKMRSLQHSGTDFRLKLALLYLENNGLEFIHVKVLDSLAHLEFRQPIGSRSFHFYNNAFCMSSGQTGCGCCQVADFMRWVKDFTNTSPHDVPAVIMFSCGSGSANYTNDHYGIALADSFGHCSPSQTSAPRQTTRISTPRQTTPLATTLSPKTTTIMQSNDNEVEPPCSEPKPVEINCNASHLTLSDSDLLQTEGTTVIFSSDGAFHCAMKLHELHTMAMELFAIAATNDAEGQHETVDVICRKGRAEINLLNPERSRAKRLVFRSDLSIGCYSKFTRFLEHIDGNMVESSTLQTSPAFSLDDWLSTKRECARTSRATANCTDGIFAFSWANISTTSASGIAVRSDETFECRQKLVTIHDHVLSQKTTTIQRPNLPVQDTVVAVCREGRVFISEGSPRRSTKTILEFYYGTTKSCQDAFQKLLKFLQTPT